VTSVLVVDDHPIVRQGLRGLLSDYPDFEVVGEAATVEEALAVHRRTRPDVCLVDIRLGSRSGLDLLDALLDDDPDSRVIMVSSFDDAEYVTRSLRTGALGYLLKVDSPAVLVTVIEAVAAGQRALSPHVTASLVDHLVDQAGAAAPGSSPALDSIERRMLTMLSRGRSNQQIADELFMSDTTVKRRLRALFIKLGVSRRAEAVGEAARLGLL
jgi:DNA-binding NarL/FixJ family response regulator